MTHNDICEAAGLKESEVIDGELTQEEIDYFKKEAERVFSIFREEMRPNIIVENGHILIDHIWEIAPAVELHETITESIFFRSYIIGRWYAVNNYHFEPDDEDIIWELYSIQGHQVIPSVGAKMMDEMVPERIIDETRLPTTVILKELSH